MITYEGLVKDKRLWWISNLNLALTPVLELLLQLVVSASVTWLIRWPTFSILIFTQTLLLYLAFIVEVYPYTEKQVNQQISFNYAMLLLICYCQLPLTGFAGIKQYANIANAIIILISLIIVINVLWLSSNMLINAYMTIKVWRKNRTDKIKLNAKKAKSV